MSCSFCQSDNPSSAEFCRACGAELPLLNGGAEANIGVDALDVTSADALPVGTLLAGIYAVERVLGQGGFGITYGCHDQMLDRRVAIKEFFPSGCGRQDATVRPSRGVSETHFGEARAQFLAEARLLARCHHAGIVGVHTAFEANSTAYMVMELLHGSSLDRLTEARGGRLSESEAVRLTERAGEALQFVHDQGLLHRDIKPENIIATDDGRVMLIDFGTAREYAQGQAQGHTIVVTPGYAPLEQYARQAKRGAFTDVYGLAATLYHLLTGAAPPAASDRAVGVMLRPVREENAQISAGVANAIEAGLEMEIAKRPQSVREFLELMHAPQKTVFVAEAAFQVALAPQNSAISQESATLQESAISPLQRDALRSLSHTPANFFSGAIQARQQLLEGAISQSPPVQLAPPSVPPSAMASSVLTSSAPTSDPYSVNGGFITQNTGTMDDSAQAVGWFIGVIFVGFAVVLALATAIGSKNSSSYPSSYNSQPSYSSSTNDSSPSYQPSAPSPAPVTRNSAAEMARQEMESTPAILPASVEMLPISAKIPVRDKGAVSSSLVNGVAEFCPDGQRVAYMDGESVVRVWDLSKHQVVRFLSLSKSHAAVSLLFSRDGESLVIHSYSQDKTKNRDEIRVWNLRTGKIRGTLSVNLQKEWLIAKAVLPDGRILIGKSPLLIDQNLQPTGSSFLWDPITGKQSATPIQGLGALSQVDFSPDGKQIVTGDKAGHIHWWDARTGVQKTEISTNLTIGGAKISASMLEENSNNGNANSPLSITALRFSRDGSALASLNNERQISVFDSTAQEIGTLSTGNSQPYAFAVSPGGSFVVQGANLKNPDRKMLWNVRSKQKIRLQAPDGRLSAVTFSPDGKQIIGLCNSDGSPSLVIWNTDATPFAPFSAPQISYSSVPSAPGGNVTVAISTASQLIATPIGRFINVRRFDGTFARVFSRDLDTRILTFSPDGSLLAAASPQGKVQLWNAQTGRQVGLLETLEPTQVDKTGSLAPRGISGLVFSPDNSLLARALTVDGKNLIELWSLKNSPHRIASLPLSRSVFVLGFSLNNQGLIFADGGVLRWYDVATQKLSAPVSSNSKLVWNLFVTAQGVAVAGDGISGNTLTLYDVITNSNPAKSSGNQERFSLKKKTSISALGASLTTMDTAVSPDGQLFATADHLNSKTGAIQVWHLPTGSLLQTLYCNSPGTESVLNIFDISGIAFSPDSTQITCIRNIKGNGNDQTWRQRQIITWKRPDAQ